MTDTDWTKIQGDTPVCFNLCFFWMYYKTLTKRGHYAPGKPGKASVSDKKQMLVFIYPRMLA